MRGFLSSLPADSIFSCSSLRNAAALAPMESESSLGPVTHNEAEGRFEISLGGAIGFAGYRIEGNRMVFPSTQVPEQFRGRGIARKLVLAGFEFARAGNLRIVPQCSYVARVLREHPEFLEPRKEG